MSECLERRREAIWKGAVEIRTGVKKIVLKKEGLPLSVREKKKEKLGKKKKIRPAKFPGGGDSSLITRGGRWWL